MTPAVVGRRGVGDVGLTPDTLSSWHFQPFDELCEPGAVARKRKQWQFE